MSGGRRSGSHTSRTFALPRHPPRRGLSRYAPRGVQFITLTRYYDEPEKHAQEKARADSVWKAVYADVGPLPAVTSTTSMVRYGGSSTPTFVFIDRRGIVRGYTPTRLTTEELERRVAAIEK